MKVKIVDVAREANVSVATVSRVVNSKMGDNNKPLVNQETEERVREAIERTGYKPNAIARSLKIQKTNTLGIMIPDISNPLYTDIVRGVEDVSNIYNYNIILSNTDFDPDHEDKSLDTLVEKQCDGILYIGKDLTPEMRQKLLNANSEIVLGCVSDDQGELSAVLIDNERAAYDLTKSMIEQGHQHIAFIFDVETGQISDNRIKGIKRAMEEAGLELDPELMLTGRINLGGGHKAMKDLLESGKECDLVICMNDQVALGAIRAAEEAGKHVPDDISVTGFNDYWISAWVNPSITTVKQPMYDLGAMAARMLIKMIEKVDGDVPKNKTICVPYDIVFRDSTRNLSK